MFFFGLCYVVGLVYFVMDACLLCCLLIFQYLAKRLAGKNVSEMTYFVSGGTYNLNSVNLLHTDYWHGQLRSSNILPLKVWIGSMSVIVVKSRTLDTVGIHYSKWLFWVLVEQIIFIFHLSLQLLKCF